MADERYSISLGLDTSGARSDLTAFEKEYASRVKSMGEKLASVRPVIFGDESKAADKVVKQILNVRKSMAQLKDEKRQLGKIMSSEWESMSPQLKKSRGGEMKTLKDNIAKTEKRGKQLAAELRAIQDEPVRLLEGLTSQLAMIRSKINSATPSLEQATILTEAKKLAETINGKFKDLGSVRRGIEKIKVDSREAWMADKGPKNAETRKQHVAAMRQKQQPLVEQERELQQQISVMTNQKNDLVRSFSKASSKQYKELVEFGKQIEAKIADAKKYRDYLDVLLEGADLPLNAPKGRYKPQRRGVQLSEQMPQFDAYEMLGGRRKRRGLARELVAETPQQGRKNNNITGGRAPNLILAALVKTGAITAEQAAKTAQGLGGVGVQLVVVGDALEEFEASLRKANEATEAETTMEEGELKPKGANAKTLAQKAAERELLGPGLGEVTSETTDFKRMVAEYNSYISSMLTAFSFGDESRVGGVNNKNSGLYPMSPSDNPNNLEDDAESKNAVITAKQFEEAAMLAFEAGTMQNEAATKLGQSIIPILINRTRKGQFMSPFADSGEDEDGNPIKKTPAWETISFGYSDAIISAYEKYVAEFQAKGTPAIEPYEGQANSIAGLMGNGNTASGIELMIAAITKGARQPEFAPNVGEDNIGEVINPGSLIAMEIFDQLPQLGRDFVELAHEVALTLGIIKTSTENPYAESVTQGMADYTNPAMTTFERMFDANNYNPRKKISANGENVELGYGPGKLEPMEQVGVKSATITKVIQDLATEFKKIYGDTIGNIGNQVRKVDPVTFKPADANTVAPVEMKNIDAFIQNRKAFIDFVKTARLTVSDITMALPAVEDAFDKLSMVIDQGVAGSKLSRGEIKDQGFAYRQGQQFGMESRAQKRFGKGSSTTPIFSDLIDATGSVDDAVAGLANGVSAREKDIADLGEGAGKKFGRGFSDGIGANSPAKYFIDAAGDAVDGVIVGTEMRLKDLSEAGRAMAESFHSGYTDQEKVNAITRIHNAEVTGNNEAAAGVIENMRQDPASLRNKPEFVLRGEKEVAERNKKLAERLKELAESQDDLLVAIDIETSGALNAKDGKPGKRSMAYAVGASAGYGVESEGRAAGNPNVPVIVPQSEGVMFGMVVPPKDPQSGTRFTRGAAQGAGLVGEGDSNSEILPNLIKRMEELGIGEDKQQGDEQTYVDQLQDIAFLLNKVYELQIPLTLHNSGLSDLTTLGKEFANYGIAAPTGAQFEEAGLLIETQTMATMLKKLFGEDIPKSITSLYQFFTGKVPGPELIPKTGVKPDYTDNTAKAHDPEIDAQAGLVLGFSMRKMAEEVGAKQITITKTIADFVKASWATVSDAIGGFRRFGPGKGDPKKDYRNTTTLKSYGRQAATHTGELQPVVPTIPRRAPVTASTSTQTTLFDDVNVDSAMNAAEKMRILEEELAKLEEQREVEKERIKLERERLKQLYEAEKVIEAMSENRGIGFDNLTNSPINNRVIQDKDKARLARNNAIVDEAKKNPEFFAEVERQIASRWGKVPERFVATLGTASRELADAIQKAINRVNRKINAIQVETGQRTPTPRGPRPPGGGGGNKPPGPRGPDDIPGGPDSPTPEYQDLMDGKITGNQNASWIDQEIEQSELEAKRRSNDLKGMNRDVKAHEKVVADANRKMVDSWISTRYSLYDVASTYEEMGKKLRVLTSYIREAVMVNSSYETSFTAVERVMQPLPDEIDGMRQRLVLMTQELPVAFDQLAKIATLGGQMGINADGINNFTEQVVKYSTITGMSADTVAEKFGRISQLADIPADDFDKLASAVAFAGINAVATDQEIITLTESIAAASNLAGFGADETIGLATAISSLGIAPEQARGVIVRLFGDIERGMQKGGKELDAYSKHLGLSAKETKNLWETDPQAFFKRMLQNLSTAGSMTTALDNLNIKETREVNTLQRLAKNMDVYNQSMGDAKESYANGTFLADAYAKTQDNVAAKLEILNNQMKILQDNIGSAFAEGPLGLKMILDGLSAFMEFVNKIVASPIGGVVTKIVAGVTAMVAIFVAYQVASYKATAATLAMKTAMVQLGKMGGENTGIKGLLDVLTGQERMIIDSNGRLRSITKDRLEEMEKMGKIVEEGSPVDRALKAGLDVRKAATPGSMDDEIAYNAGMTLGPRSDNAGQILPNVAEELQGPSIAQLQEQIAVNRQLIEIRAQIAQESLAASEKLRIYALAQGDAAAAEAAAAQSAASSREIGQLGNLDKSLEENLTALETASIDPEAVVPKEIAKNVDDSTQSLNNMGAGLDSVATKADKGSVATTRFGKVVGGLSKAAGWIGLILGLVATATEIYKSFQIDLMEAGGGLDSFREAIYKDTAAWKENGEAIGTVQSKVTTSQVGLTTWAKSMESTTGSSAKMTSAITETTDSITEQTLALGENSMQWLAQAAMSDDQIQNMFKRYFEAGKDLDKLAKDSNITIQDMVGMALSDPGKGAEEYLRGWFTSSEAIQKESPNLYADLMQIAHALDGTTKSGIENSKIMKALGGAFGEADDGAGDLNNELDNTIARVYTLTDYVGDLSSILSAAFTIRYGKEEATDALASSWENVKNRIDDAREAIEKIKDEIKSMTADRNILEYQLNIALKYGDSMRADKIRAELDAKNKELADKDQELAKAQGAASTSLEGDNSAARDNRAVMRGLVQDYNKYLEALANTAQYEGLSDKAIAKKKRFLKQQADQAKADMLAKGAQLGFSENEMAPYVKSFKDFRTIVDKLPKELTLRVDADPGTRAFMEFWAKQNSGGSGKKNGSSKTPGGSNLGPDGKPAGKPWTGPTTPKWNPDKGAPTLNAPTLAQSALGILSDVGEFLGDIIATPVLGIFNKIDLLATGWADGGAGALDRWNAAEAVVGLFRETELEKQQKTEFTGYDAQAEQDAYESKLLDFRLAQAKNEVEFNAIPAKLDRMKSPKADRDKMAKEHAKLYPGEYNPFNGGQNPGKAKVWGTTEKWGRAGVADMVTGASNARDGKNAAASGAQAIMKRYQDDRAIPDTYQRAGYSQAESESLIKKNGATHAARYPGEYNPFTRQQNPWPKAKEELDKKGLVPLKDRAALHAAMYPGEYNPYTQLPNAMTSGDANVMAAMKDKKTRLALGAEHARLYPGEYNPYLNKVNDLFNKDSKKGAGDLVRADTTRAGVLGKVTKIMEDGDKRDKALGKALEDFNKTPFGSSTSKPIHTSLLGKDILTLAKEIALKINEKDKNYMGGAIKGYASGGLIPGKSPQNPRRDNLVAMGPSGMIGIRSGEFIQSQPAVKYYGLDFMNAINNLQIPRYASGGMIGTVSGGGSSVVELSPSAVMQIMAIANRPVNLYSDDRQIASSANRGNMLLAMRGSN